jgi:hypothetical protein
MHFETPLLIENSARAWCVTIEECLYGDYHETCVVPTIKFKAARQGEKVTILETFKTENHQMISSLRTWYIISSRIPENEIMLDTKS